jgi:hypothetical protein
MQQVGRMINIAQRIAVDETIRPPSAVQSLRLNTQKTFWLKDK